MIKLFTLATLLFFGSTSAQAALSNANKFMCANVGGTLRWGVVVDLETARAAFYDSHSTLVLLLKNVRTSDTQPAELLYTFEGQDGSGKMQIEFNFDKMSASVTMNLGTLAQVTLRSLDGCKANNNFDLD